MNFRDQKISNESIELGTGELIDSITRCSVQNSKISLGSANSFLFVESEFQECIFSTRKPLNGYRFTRSSFFDCTFLGSYSGCRFISEGEKGNSYSSLDFSKCSLLDLCDFEAGINFDDFEFPNWPHVIITKLDLYKNEWKNLKLPPQFKIIQNVIANAADNVGAVSIYLPKYTAAPDEIKDVLSGKPFIYMRAI